MRYDRAVCSSPGCYASEEGGLAIALHEGTAAEGPGADPGPLGRPCVSTRLINLGGTLSVILAILHAFAGWPSISGELVSAGVDPGLVAGIAVGWYFGSVAMVALGMVVLAVAGSVATNLWAFRVTLVVGLSYAVFGLGALLYRSPKPQFLAFAVMGALIGGGGSRARKVARRGSSLGVSR